MKMPDIRKKAADMGLKINATNKAEVIRAIQCAEGNTPCFGSGKSECIELDCCWRGDCLPKTKRRNRR